MHDLKPCPFCGGEVYFTTMYVGNDEENCIACEGCDMIFTIVWLSPNKETLTAMWNRRTNDADAT